MQGYNALWVPGTDHAGIATQLMVERHLATEGTSRRELGREKFLERMWEWKQQYHGNIRQQLDLLGASCDWTRERFTLDEGLSRAVREAFVRLYEEGLITRGEYMVNWSPTLGTAVSDLEVETRTVAGKLYHIAYPVEGSDEKIVIATTRPETMLGDTAVALHPEDERYLHLHGKAAILPLVGRRLPFVPDAMVDREFGTGLVKITPFHDPNDFEVAKRHDLPGISVIGPDGHMTAEAGEGFAGLDRFEAREKVVERLREGGYLIKIEDHTHNVGHSQRGGEPIEPLVSTQWFCDVRSMADQALEAVRSGRVRLIPETWEKTWEHWLTNIKPWCVSRQLWWGHQIPAWYTEDGRCFVARSFEEAAAQAGTGKLTQDPDVLDTWFSSALWPFSILGWPDDTEDMRTFYPTSVMVTGFDILFFWVARMVMTALHFTHEVPFHLVHLTGLVRDAEGQKMSKTKGNVMDPTDLVGEYGADAVRFTLASLDSPGRDIPLNRNQIAGYRAFGNKLWNATRFALSRIPADARVLESIDPKGLAAPERWILSRLSRVAAEVSEQLEIFRFDEACNRLYHFFWGDFCDWYIELSKPALMTEGSEAPRPQVGDVLLTVLDRALRLLHPVMPFLTEELWQRLPGHEAIHPETICLAPYPTRVEAWEDSAAEAGMDALIQVVTRVRGLRAEMGLPPKARLDLHLDAADTSVGRLLAEQAPLIQFLTRVETVTLGPAPESARRDLIAGVEIGVAVEKQEMSDEEKSRLTKELEKLDADAARAEERLSNPDFLGKAPAHVIEGGRARLAEMRERQATLRSSLGLS
jgi:valyl-tRNA synthetase